MQSEAKDLRRQHAYSATHRTALRTCFHVLVLFSRRFRSFMGPILIVEFPFFSVFSNDNS